MSLDHPDPHLGDVAGLQLRDMTIDEADDGLRLSRLAGWNQTRQDWDYLLRHGKGSGFQTADGLWVATMVTLPVGPEYGWISMVLTDPDWRRRGLASRLMNIGIEHLLQSGVVPALDATPEGEKVYRSLGFKTSTQLGRWLLKPGKPGHAKRVTDGSRIRSAEQEDLEALANWDRTQAGVERKEMLRYLCSNRPDLALLEESPGGSVSGYIMGRDGDRATQLGPLVASNPVSAGRLLTTALGKAGSPVYVDAFTDSQPHLEMDSSVAWTLERPFARMIHADASAPGDPSSLFLAAGPELG